MGLVLAGLTVWVWAGAYLSARDCSQLFIKSIDTPDIRDEHGIPFQVFYGISVRATTSLSLLSVSCLFCAKLALTVLRPTGELQPVLVPQQCAEGDRLRAAGQRPAKIQRPSGADCQREYEALARDAIYRSRRLEDGSGCLRSFAARVAQM